MLSKFRDEVQASSVVSYARQKFQDLVSKIGRKEGETTSGVVTEEDANALSGIGETLFERYKSCYGDFDAKHAELVEDFLAVHGDEIALSSDKRNVSTTCDHPDKNPCALIPLGVVDVQRLIRLSNPSILTMLIICLHMRSKHRLQIAQLLVRLILTSKDMYGSFLNRIIDAKETKRNKGGQSDDYFSDSDDDSLMSGEGSVDRNTASKNVDEKRVLQCGHLIKFLIDFLRESLSTSMNQNEKTDLLRSNDFGKMIGSAMTLSSEWFQAATRWQTLPCDNIDQQLFKSVRSLMRCIYVFVADDDRVRYESLFFHFMVKIMISHRHILDTQLKSQGDRASRSGRQRLCVKRAEYIGLIACELGNTLSQHPGRVSSLCMSRSSP